MGENPVQLVREYVLGSTDPEMTRLAAVSQVYGPLTDAWLAAAGVGPGMRVADLGCGPGDVTLAAARCVGPTGSGVGVADAARPLERAGRRAEDAHLATVSFEQADVLSWEPSEPLDAVVGRFILLHLPDPTAAGGAAGGAAVRAAELVRPGGIVAFADVALTTRGALPELSLLTAYNRWFLETFRRAGRTDALAPCAG